LSLTTTMELPGTTSFPATGRIRPCASAGAAPADAIAVVAQAGGRDGEPAEWLAAAGVLPLRG
jgi:hypothetical protein